MTTPSVNLTLAELFNILPDLCQKIREDTTLKHIPVKPTAVTVKSFTQLTDLPLTLAIAENDETAMSYVVQDPYKTYLLTLCPDQMPTEYVVTKESHAL